jgi:hypothetical protein
MNDISLKFRWNQRDALIAQKLIELEATPEAIVYFSKVCDQLTDYSYWFSLSTLWIASGEIRDLERWKLLFSSSRPGRNKSIMKPSELQAFEYLPYFIKVYRAHRENEVDWIAYTLDPIKAGKFALERGVKTIKEYRVKKRDVLALFLRRGESEIIILDREKAEFLREIEVRTY